MKFLVSIIFSLFIVVHAHAHADVIDERSGITISFVNNEETFPAKWMNDPVNATAVVLDSSEYERSVLIVKSALAKYPVDFLKKNLKTVYVFKSIAFYGQGYGGTCSNHNVYLGNKGEQMGYSDLYLEQSFHHEFSSILWTNYKALFNEEEWVKENGLSYGTSGVQALIDGDGSLLKDSLFHEKGFLFEYAQSTLENDINAFAENIFIPTDWFELAVKTYPILTRKYKLILQFYRSMDSQFTAAFFENLAKETAEQFNQKTGKRLK